MPARVAGPTGHTNGGEAGIAKPDDLDWESPSAEEQRTRKRLHKAPSVRAPANGAARKSLLPSPNNNETNNVENKSHFTSRRRKSSIPNAKLPVSTRTFDESFETKSTNNSTITNPALMNNGAGAPSHDIQTRKSSGDNAIHFDFASLVLEDQDDSKSTSDFRDFLTPVSFDEFHNSITTDEQRLAKFPFADRGTANVVRRTEQQPGLPQSNLPVLNPRKVSGTGSIARKGSGVRQQNSTSSNLTRASSKSESVPQAAGASVLRSRRQSHFPPNSFNNPNAIVKLPRQSIGPGTFIDPSVSDNKPIRRRPSAGGRRSDTDIKSVGPVLPRTSHRAQDNTGVEVLRLEANMRDFKAKSFQPTRVEAGKDLLTPTRTPDHSRSPSANVMRMAGRHNASRSGTPGRTTTPSSQVASNKRMSVMPPHATGLGARTISPTDARRLKRMSITNEPPPIPQCYATTGPPTPQLEPTSSKSRSRAQSPGQSYQKSVTPTSTRTTPDPNRKSYSSGQSLSSSTSYTSVRNAAALLTRTLHNTSSSRLPTPKPRSDQLHVENNEDVPPVPAIPKAYESPQSELDQPFFSARSSSMVQLDPSVLPSPVMSTYTDPISTSNERRTPSSLSRKSLHAQQSESESQQKRPSQSKKNSQPLALPPLNLQPLSTPTAAKIKSLEEGAFEIQGRPYTPSSRQVKVKTPSTPMTASKVSFFSKSRRGSDDLPANSLRSSTSHHALRAEVGNGRTPSNCGLNSTTNFGTEKASLRNISPFISSSLPQSEQGFGAYMLPKYNTELVRSNTQVRPSGPRAPSFSITPKLDDKASPVEAPSGFSAAALRRKLSRKRSANKLVDNPKAETGIGKQDESMPPPKLPASATWSNLAGVSTSPAPRLSYLTSRRKASTSSVHLAPTGDKQEGFGSTPSLGNYTRTSTESVRSVGFLPNRSTSHIRPLHSSADNLTASTDRARPKDTDLDRDDLVAEEEMKKLASRRKDLEAAARQLDSLYKRARPREYVSPDVASRTASLNRFELGEIVDYPEIYFTGTRKADKIIGDMEASATNFGYDDERGDYNIVEGDHLAYRYEVVDLLGKGSFGQVIRCIDHKAGSLVAVKIIRNKKRFHQQALVEVDILQRLREWDPDNQHSVVNFDQSFYFRGHLCISTNLLDMNLYEFIKAHDFRGFSLKLVRRFTKQLLSSLVLLHGRKVIHCDLKPENVLLTHPMHSEIKVIDFGSSCFENEKVYTYIQSRFYRSPEVILGMSYGMPIDMWSLGCILAELYTGYPIFPGENEQEQLACIMEVFGPPEKHLIEKSSRKKLFFDSMGKPRLTVSSKGRRRRPSSKELRQVLKCDDEAFLDFITRCLRWDPARRLNPHEAMLHEFITGTKMGNGRRAATIAAANSHIRHVNSAATPSTVRPLPQPPATSFKNGIAARPLDTTTSSPIKVGPRKQPVASSLQPGIAAKRASHAAMASSTTAMAKVPLGQRSMSERPSLAAAAAAASLVR